MSRGSKLLKRNMMYQPGESATTTVEFAAASSRRRRCRTSENSQLCVAHPQQRHLVLTAEVEENSTFARSRRPASGQRLARPDSEVVEFESAIRISKKCDSRWKTQYGGLKEYLVDESVQIY
ncbi:hypothetical protein EAI_08175 [Harpegnathos saltator]|uniref:Uncharacterized protein n=1 Tax=Harpegnathos saltator TaxID=610380 RepID=E2C1M5_HARSA|nr:hypothetical protein EAI_08175 [Harpegnathos saltator]